MYEGNNKSALLSQQLIADSLLKLLEENMFADISVSMICRSAGVSRQTFYTLFGTKENVMIYRLSESCRFSPEKHDTVCRKKSLAGLCDSYACYIDENRRMIELLVRNDMMSTLYNVQYESFLGCECFLRDVQGSERALIVDFIVSGLGVIAKWYVQSGSTDRDELSRIIYTLFSGAYFTN